MEKLSESPSSGQSSGTGSINPLNAIRVLHSARVALCAQLGLYFQLARIEWAEEKHRLLKMLAATLSGFACLLCLMLFFGILILAVSWDSAYRIHAIILMMGIYGVGIGIALRVLQTLSMRGAESFSALREEVSVDLNLIMSRL